MRILTWLVRAFLFFALFGFAINNQQLATVNWFFSYAWTARMVIIVLAAFVGGHGVRRARDDAQLVAPPPPRAAPRDAGRRPRRPPCPPRPSAPDVTVVRDGL